MKRFCLFLLIVLTLHLTALGQYDIGLTVGGGLSKIYTNFSSAGTRVNNHFKLSGYCGLFYNFHLSDYSLLETELLFIQITGKEYHSKPLYDSLGNSMRISFVDNYHRRISYIGVPIYYGIKLKKLAIKIGVQASLSIANRERDAFYVSYPKSNGPTTTYDTFKKLNIDSYDFGVSGELIFNFTNKFAIEGSYYYGINNIYKNNDYIWSIHQMTIGLRYKFFTKKLVCETEKK